MFKELCKSCLLEAQGQKQRLGTRFKKHQYRTQVIRQTDNSSLQLTLLHPLSPNTFLSLGLTWYWQIPVRYLKTEAARR